MFSTFKLINQFGWICCYLLVAGLIVACRKKQTVEHSFYYWKTSFDKEYAGNTSLVQALQVQHFYIRYLDVDWSENMNIPVPVGQLSNINYETCKPFVSGRYTPVVFITNRTFQHITDAWCDSLAVRLAKKINSISSEIEQTIEDHAYWDERYDMEYRFAHQDSIKIAIRQQRKKVSDEIQIDCDWTATTQKKYFRFLSRFKQQITGKQLSATVRLYPYKYHQQTGVPPVDKGLLMCYNLSDIKSPATRNSVFDLATLKAYLTINNYPLPLDVALPLFGWQAWFRGAEFKGIVYDREQQLAEDVIHFKSQKAHTIQVVQDTVLGNNYLREGDVLRTEYPDEIELQKAANMLQNEFPTAQRITFYYWSTENCNRYETTIRKIYNSW